MNISLNTSEERSRKVKDTHKYQNIKQSSVNQVSYIMIVMEIMNKIGMHPVEEIMQTEAKLMDVMSQIQSDFTVMQEYFSKIENLSHSGGAYISCGIAPSKNHPNTTNVWSPNAMNGLAYNEFHFSQDPGSWNQYTIAPDFLAATQGFMSAFKDVYSCQEARDVSPSDPALASNCTNFKITNNQGEEQNINLASTYDNLNANTSGSWGVLYKVTGKLKAFSDGQEPAPGSMVKASLLQQYVFYKYKLDALTHEKLLEGKGINPNPSCLDFNADPASGNCDGIIKSLFTYMTSFDTTVSTSRGGDPNNNFSGALINTSSNILGLFGLASPLNNFATPNYKPDTWIGAATAGFLGSMAFAAFNYFWSKNPNASTDQSASTIPNPPTTVGGISFGWNGSKGVVADGDKLSSWYSDAQSSSSLLSSSSSETSTTMQQYTSEMSQYQNIGQNIIKSGSEGVLATIRNYKS